MFNNRKEHTIRRFFKLFIKLFTIIYITFSIYSFICKPSDKNEFYYNELEIKVLNVGSADSILLLYHDKVVLIDTAISNQRDNLRKQLDNLQINKIDYLILTHYHDDHIGGASTILTHYNVDYVFVTDTNFYCSTQKLFNSAYPHYVFSMLYNFKAPKKLYNGDVLTIDDDITLNVLGPIGSDQTDVNDSSLVIKAIYNDFSMLFCADAEYSEENILMDNCYDELSADVLKIGHHGFPTSNSIKFIKAVNPQYAIFSSRPKNPAEFSKTIVRSRFKKCGIPVYQTHSNGTVSIITDGSEYVINGSKNNLH